MIELYFLHMHTYTTTAKEPKSDKRSIPAVMKQKVWELYNGEHEVGKCCICECAISRSTFDCGHIVSGANGGKIELSNLIPMCHECNTSLSSENLYDFMIRWGYNINSQAMRKADGKVYTESFVKDILDEHVTIVEKLSAKYFEKLDGAGRA